MRIILQTISLIIIVAVLMMFYQPLSEINIPQLPLKHCQVEKLVVPVDKDNDGIYDLDDIVQGARQEVINKPRYRSAYYAGGYPPEDEGVCTDVVWRALKSAGYDLKTMMDEDIKKNLADYPRVNEQPDPNIDFRRVPNQISFFKKYAQCLTTEVIPWDKENLKQWQGGDIVTFGPHAEHVAIISDKRRRDGVPLIIHNCGPYPREENYLLTWPSPITYHFRFPKVD